MVELYGFEWLTEVYPKIMEDKRDEYLVMMSIMPLARTPMDKESGRWTGKYMRDLKRMFYEMTPWENMGGSVRSAYSGKVKKGTIAVVLDDPKLAKNPMFRGAKVVK